MKFNPNYQISPELTKLLLEVERHKEALNILPVSASFIASLRETARLMTTHYSTQIEGNMLTQKEVKEISDGKKGGFLGRERDEREVKDYFLALEFVEEEVRSEALITEKLIQKIHGLTFHGSKKATQYRDGQNRISDSSTGAIVYLPPEAQDVKPLMKALVIWINDEIEKDELPVPIIAGIAHYQFATIHPYFDGNGRTARLFTTFLLHKTGYGMNGIYSLEEYYAKNLQGYYNALDVGGSHNYYFGRAEANITPFLDYFLDGMSKSFGSVRKKAELMKDKASPEISVAKHLRDLRPQQRQVLSLFTKYREVTLAEVAQHLGMKDRNVHTLLKKWIDSDFIQILDPSKKGRTYGLTDDWERIVKGRLDRDVER